MLKLLGTQIFVKKAVDIGPQEYASGLRVAHKGLSEWRLLVILPRQLAEVSVRIGLAFLAFFGAKQRRRI